MRLEYIVLVQATPTQDTHNQGSGTPNGVQSGRNTKDRKNKHPIRTQLIITTYFKSTIDKVHSAVDSLKVCCLKMAPLWPKHVAHKHRIYMFYDILRNILVN
jgi:hypothetical protein